MYKPTLRIPRRVHGGLKHGRIRPNFVNFIKKHQDTPFYIHLWPNDVHDPHEPDATDRARFSRFANNPYKQDFYAVLYRLDQQIGRLLDSLEALGLTKNSFGNTDGKIFI